MVNRYSNFLDAQEPMIVFARQASRVELPFAIFDEVYVCAQINA